ncbi:TMEM175 family protein [Cupriavidus necator]|uniref:TMEM175 family protein n=1 Tax=Cupriavidus necator TaxID=106590 RepID=UPI003BEEE525
MREGTITADRLTAFSDAVFAVIVTIMVLYSCGRYAGVRTTNAACGEVPITGCPCATVLPLPAGRSTRCTQSC